ncbi:MAG: hypothetical protein V1645_01415 [archaeon]
MEKTIFIIFLAAFACYVVSPPHTWLKDFLSISFVVVFLFIEIWITLAHIVVRGKWR